MTPSAQQEHIFNWFRNADFMQHQHLLIRARAGTGKTTTILEACRHIDSKAKVRLFAFNRDIADELAAKLLIATPERKALSKSRFKAGTLNSIGDSFLRRRAIETGCDRNFVLDKHGERNARIVEKVVFAAGLPVDDALTAPLEALLPLLKGIMPYVGTGYRAHELTQVLDVAAEYDLSPPTELVKLGLEPERYADLAIKAICASAEYDGFHDYDDQIFLTVRNGWAQRWYDVVIVDEAQDMNVAQLELAQQVCKDGGRIVLVGDDRQAVYGFRGADAGALDRLKVALDADERPLTVTYRCPKAVVELAKQFVPDFTAAATAPEGHVERIEATKIVERANPGDFVLSRVNAPLAKLAFGFIKAHKRVRILGRENLGEPLQKLILKIDRRTGASLLDKIEDWLQGELHRVQGEDKKAVRQKALLHDKAETLAFLAAAEGTAQNVARRLHMLFEGDTNNADQTRFVTCSTVHKIKGKEAPNVFVLEDTLFLDNGDQAEEENIAYVAYTRAKQALYLCTGRP